MKDEYKKVKKTFQDDKHLNYHLSQFDEPYRSTIHLFNFMKSFIDVNSEYKAMDVACGGGANIYHFSKLMKNTEWVGLDWTDKFIKMNESSMKDINFEFVKGDFYKLNTMFKKDFDLVFSIQTLSWLPEYESALEQLFKISKKYIFISSLFSDYNVDVISKVNSFDEKWEPKDSYYYNIYSFRRFEKYCYNLGAKKITAEDFKIDLELGKTEDMGTYTVKTADKDLIQFSGPLHMPWKFIAIEL